MRLQWSIALLTGVLCPTTLALRTRPRATTFRHRRRWRPIGASITVHPPKFGYVAKFLEQYSNCPAAQKAMDVYIVFSNADNRSAFEHGMWTLLPNVPTDLWKAVVPPNGIYPTNTQKQIAQQQVAAWKKWYGIAHMMDLGKEAPEYGLLLDSELQIYDMSDCGGNSSWGRFHARLRALERSKLWPAARVGTEISYPIDDRQNMTGKEYDRALIRESLRYVFTNDTRHTPEAAGAALRDSVEKVLFSWWTDVPYVNLNVARRMMGDIATRPRGFVRPAMAELPVLLPEEAGQWREFSSRIMFPRFEHLMYQVYCVVHEGYRYNDVTNVTGYSKWGSYNEDPQPSSRISELHPLWVSAKIPKYISERQMKAMDTRSPPMLIFHVDHEQVFFETRPWMAKWNVAMGASTPKTVAK